MSIRKENNNYVVLCIVSTAIPPSFAVQHSIILLCTLQVPVSSQVTSVQDITTIFTVLQWLHGRSVIVI
jgi:hypothetical protein